MKESLLTPEEQAAKQEGQEQYNKWYEILFRLAFGSIARALIR